MTLTESYIIQEWNPFKSLKDKFSSKPTISKEKEAEIAGIAQGKKNPGASIRAQKSVASADANILDMYKKCMAKQTKSCKDETCVLTDAKNSCVTEIRKTHGVNPAKLPNPTVKCKGVEVVF